MKITKETQISGLANHDMREAIGAICVHWSLLELMVERVIANLEGRPGTVTYTKDLSHRLDDLKAVAKAKLPKDRRQRLSQIIGFIKDLKEERHRAAHGLWGMDDDGNFISLFPRDASGRIEQPTDREELRNIKRQIWDAYGALGPFVDLSKSVVLASPHKHRTQARRRPVLPPDPQATQNKQKNQPKT